MFLFTKLQSACSDFVPSLCLGFALKLQIALRTGTILASSAGNSIGAFPGQNKRADMLSDGK